MRRGGVANGGCSAPQQQSTLRNGAVQVVIARLEEEAQVARAQLARETDDKLARAAEQFQAQVPRC